GDKRLAYGIRDRTCCLKLHDIEEVARVLSVQRRTQFAGKEVRRVESLDLDEELVAFLRGRTQFAQDRRHQAAADNDAWFHLYAPTRFIDEQLGRIALQELDVCPWHCPFEPFGDCG